MKTLDSEHSAGDARALRMVRALANPTRYRIVQILAARKEATSSGLGEVLSLAPSSLFDHLSSLKAAGIVQSTEHGSANVHCLDPAALDFLAATLSGLSQRARSWERMVDAAQREDSMQIRDATADDATAIARIYNEGIEDRVATLETQLRTPEERAEWLAARGPRHPVLVATDRSETVAGWASLNSFNPRPAYDHVVDLSVYVARDRRGCGIGDALLGALAQRARSIGYHKMVLAAFPFNAPGMRLYERHGFQTVGIYHEQGMLDRRWVDVIVMEKILA